MDSFDIMAKHRIPKLIVEFSLPAILSSVSTSLYNVIDRIFIGHSAGTLGIAAVAIGFPLQMLQAAFGVLVGMGASIVISIRLGEKKYDEASKIIGNTFVLLAIQAAIITILSLLFMDPLLRFFGASNDVLPYARDYMTIIMGGTIFILISYGMANMVRSVGKPKTAMAMSLISPILNACFAPLFIFGFHWGIRGAALATILATVISAVWIMAFFVFTKSSHIKLQTKQFLLKRKIVGEIVVIGIAPTIMMVAQSFESTILNRQLNIYGGDIAISAIGIIISLQALFTTPVTGIGQGVQPILGYNYGAKKYKRVHETVKYSLIFSTAFALLFFIFIQIFPSQIMSLFSSDKKLIAFGANAMVLVFISLPVFGIQQTGVYYFQSMNKPIQAIILNSLRQIIVLIPLILILPIFFKLHGILISIPLADIIATAITVTFLSFEVKKLPKNDISEENHSMSVN